MLINKVPNHKAGNFNKALERIPIVCQLVYYMKICESPFLDLRQLSAVNANTSYYLG